MRMTTTVISSTTIQTPNYLYMNLCIEQCTVTEADIKKIWDNFQVAEDAVNIFYKYVTRKWKKTQSTFSPLSPSPILLATHNAHIGGVLFSQAKNKDRMKESFTKLYHRLSTIYISVHLKIGRT